MRPQSSNTPPKQRLTASTPLPSAGRTGAEAAFRRMAHHKQTRHATFETIGAELVDFFKHDVQKRQTKFGKVAEIWQQLIPSTLIDHTCMESFAAGTLKVLVDSSSHLYELRTVLLAGLEKQILLAGRPHGLRKVTLKPGRWYQGDSERTRRISFE